MDKTKRIVMTALYAAIVFIGTIIIKIPTPTGGYVHPGDGFVILAGLLLGPVYGALAAGLGSMLADVLSGYLLYAPATLVIKALTAIVAALVFSAIKKAFSPKHETVNVIVSGVLGEALMVLGYLIFEVFLLAGATGASTTAESLAAGGLAALAALVPNIIQGIFGVVVSTALYPLLKKTQMLL